MKSLAFVLALVAAAPVAAQTASPNSPYGAGPATPWPDRAVYQAPATSRPEAAAVLHASYQSDAPDLRAGANGSQSGTSRRPGASASPAKPQPQSLPMLPPRGSSGGTSSSRRSRSELPSALTVASSLAVVLGLFLVVAWALRRATPGEASLLPGEVLEVLGRKVISQRQQLHLLRCGSKLLLVSVTPDGAETLTEIDDPDEVNRLAGLCRQSQPGSATATFRQVMRQFSDERGEGRDV